jgi:hypothetical protein
MGDSRPQALHAATMETEADLAEAVVGSDVAETRTDSPWEHVGVRVSGPE